MAEHLKLWLISQTANNDYDTYDSAVVVAPDDVAARAIHPGGTMHWDGVWHSIRADGSRYEASRTYSDWAEPDNVKATMIGEARDDLKLGHVICASFNAG